MFLNFYAVVGNGPTWDNTKIQKKIYSKKVSKPIIFFEFPKHFKN